MAAKFANTLTNELNIVIDQSYFWLDCEIVLKYIANLTKWFSVFVSNRLGVIRTLTNPPQWYHISGSDNPADIVNQGLGMQRFDV